MSLGRSFGPQTPTGTIVRSAITVVAYCLSSLRLSSLLAISYVPARCPSMFSPWPSLFTHTVCSGGVSLSLSGSYLLILISSG